MVVKDEINYNMPLATVPEIYELIVSDLKKAETMVPANYTKEPYARNGVNIAVSQGAVKATLAYVYMAMAGWPLNKGTEYYQLAAAKAKEVIDAAKKGTYYYKLLPDYKQVYSMEYNKNNPEVLLGVYYNLGIDELTNAPLADFLADYAYGGGGWGDTNGEIKFWYDFPEGSRKDASYFPKIILKNETKLRDWWEDPNPEAPRVVVAPCFMKKVETTTGEEFDYTNPKISMNQNGEKTHQIIRLAEVYCWYAEAVGRSKTGSITEAVNLLNEVRNRANGAVVADLKNNKAIKTCGLSNEMIQRILNIAKKYHSATDPYIDGRAITEPASIDHMDEFGLSPEMQKLIRDTREVVPNVMEYVKTTGAEAEKVNIFMADLEEREVLRKELMAIPELSISSSMYNNLEVNAKGADKGSALLWLADYLGIDREETMSFGDGENDIPMIQAAGIGVAMENALDTVKAAADMITLKNDEDGVAAAIRKIIFGSSEK